MAGVVALAKPQAGVSLSRDALLRDLNDRRRALLEARGGMQITATTVWRLVSGLGAGHVLENGFVLDRNLGVPFLPGSSIKGAVKAWARNWTAPEEWERCEALFGGDPMDGAGQVIFHDAFPTTADALELDVMTVHYPGYYRNESTPGGTEAPIPVTFLSVPAGIPFVFGLSPGPAAAASPAERKMQLDLASSLLRDALTKLGVGGKTAVGYGHFTVR